jgi:hypothetical protein
MALSEFKMPLSMAKPCSVKAYDKYLVPPLPFEVSICNLKSSHSIFAAACCLFKKRHGKTAF